MIQGTPEWHEWRKQGIGASEVACLLGPEPYGMTPFKLWRIKTGQDKKGDGSNPVFQRGHEVEAAIRAGYELDTCMDFGPACFEHSEWPFIRASLDGWNAPNRKGVEIKMVGADAIQQPIPRHHYIQVQTQMLVTATDEWTYIRDCRGNTVVEVIKADPTTQRDILAACWSFWDCVQRNVAPAFTDEDWVPDERPTLVEIVAEWKASTTTAGRKMARRDMLDACTHRRTLCQGVKISKDPERITEVKDGE